MNKEKHLLYNKCKKLRHKFDEVDHPKKIDLKYKSPLIIERLNACKWRKYTYVTETLEKVLI